MGSFIIRKSSKAIRWSHRQMSSLRLCKSAPTRPTSQKEKEEYIGDVVRPSVLLPAKFVEHSRESSRISPFVQRATFRLHKKPHFDLDAGKDSTCSFPKAKEQLSWA